MGVSARTVGIVAVGVVLLVVLVAVVVAEPLILGVVVGVVGFFFAALAISWTFALAALGLAAVMLSATVSLYTGLGSVLNLAGALVLIVVGLVGAFIVKLPRPVRLLGASYLVVVSVSALFSISIGIEYAVRGWVALAMFPLAAVSVALAVQYGTPERAKIRRKAMIVLLTVLVAAVVIVCLRQAVFGLTPAELNAAKSSVSVSQTAGVVRLMGPFTSSHDLSAFLACAAPGFLALGFMLSGRKRVAAILSSVSLFLVAFLTLTRTPLVAGAVGALFAVFVWGRGRALGRLVRNIAVLAAGGAAGYGIFLLLDTDRAAEALERFVTLFALSDDNSFNDRIDRTLPIAYEHFLDSPLVGSGVGSAGPVSQQFAFLAPYGYLNADNQYLNVAVQLGVAGLVPFVGMLVAAIVTLRRLRTPWAAAGSTAVVGLAAAMMIAGYWGLLAPMAAVSMIVGLGFASESDPDFNVDESLTHTIPAQRAILR